MQDNSILIYFDEAKELELQNIDLLFSTTGVYFIFCKSIEIQYPFEKSRLIYIGMSGQGTNGIKKRLTSHFDGSSQNIGLTNYRKINPLMYTYINADALRDVWSLGVYDLESYLIRSFVKTFGVHPICNTKTGYEIIETDLPYTFNVNWNYFKSNGK